jgi:hypothetical protein
MQTDPIDDRTLIDGTGSLVEYLSISGTLDAYFVKGDGSGLYNLVIPSSSLPAGLVSSSAQTIQNLEGTNIVSSSAQKSVLGLGTTDSPTFADLTITGILTAKEFHTQQVSSSIVFQSGSTKFGNTSDDLHQFTGSIEVSGSITGSFYGDGTDITNVLHSLPSGVITSSQQISNFGYITSSDWNSVTNKPSGLVSSSVQIIKNLEGTNIVSSSDQRSVLGLGITDSPTFNNGNYNGNLVVDGTITARTYVISSSVINTQTLSQSGSTIFGNTQDDIHQFTGSVYITSSLTVPSITGSLYGTASVANYIDPTFISASAASFGFGQGGSNVTASWDTLLNKPDNIK